MSEGRDLRVYRHPAVKAAGSVSVCIFAVLFCLNYGRLGFNPLDQSVVFDGGWRVLSGQIPFRDFTALTGTTPSVMQALFFAAFGVNWFAYCLHAAIFNGAFCLLVFRFLRLVHLPFATALFYAWASGIAFYPLMGTPYMEQHGFFFLLAAMLAFHAGVRARKAWLRAMCAALGALLFVACFFSKQNVALFGLVPLGTFLLFVPRQRNRRATATAIAGGTLLASALLIAVVVLAGISPRSLFTELFEVPLVVSDGRGNPLKWFFFGPFIQGLNLITVGISSIAFAASLFAYRRGAAALLPRTGMTVWLAALAAAFEVACMVFARSTDNQKENCFPFVFLSLGLLHAAMRSAPGLRPHRPLLAAMLVLLSLRDATQFVSYVRSRSVQDVDFREDAVIPFQTPELAFLHYHVWQRYSSVTAPDIDRLIAILRETPGNFLLISDYAILYGLTGKPSPLPSLWFHQALGMAAFQSAFMPAYEKQLLANLHSHRVKTIVLENKSTWAGVSLHTFPALSALVHARTKATQSVGPFTILHLSEPF